ncbi:hypothetical protein Slin15195_G092270 [Septoria linicola]|uniref:F-box domain-containing protein n=1 Tax=Septoria linicola TaxID=215465 RepID=A0A9Q9ENX0_9PEZI|nr:hypothetical protein Slin14017_G055390 [Septoria linicola]USW55908.1 hypothetical protein Slin15195_G092270 [Septoria linicola]
MRDTQARSFASVWPKQNQKPGPSNEDVTRSFASLRVDHAQASDSSVSAASHRVLTTYELLEPILLNLTCQQALVAQRVARSWRSVVQRSQPLQEISFHHATEKPLQPAAWQGHSSMHRVDYGVHRIVYDTLRLELCPAAPIQQPSGSLGPIITSWTARELGSVLQLSVGLGGAIEPVPPDLTASWWNMHIASPPLPAISLDFLPDVPEQAYSMTLYNPTGVRLGELFDWTWKLGSLFESTTGGRLDGRIAVASFWLTCSDERAEFEEAW